MGFNLEKEVDYWQSKIDSGGNPNNNTNQKSEGSGGKFNLKKEVDYWQSKIDSGGNPNNIVETQPTETKASNDTSAHAEAERETERKRKHVTNNILFEQWKEGFDKRREEKNAEKRAELQKKLDNLDASRAYVTTTEQSDEIEKQRKEIVSQMEKLGGDQEEKQSAFKGAGSRTEEHLTAGQAEQYRALTKRLDELNQNAAYISTTAASDEYERERKDILNQLHSLDEAAGRENRSYDGRERAGAFFGSWGKGTGASYTNAAANLIDVGNEVGSTAKGAERELADLEAQLARAQTAYQEAVKEYGEAGATVERNLLADAQQKYDAKKALYASTAERDRAAYEKTKATAADMYDVADRLLTQSEQDMQKAKYGTSAVGSFALDAAKTGLDIAADTALSAVGVPGLASMATRVYGSETQQARLQGDDAQTAAAKGLKSALIEVATEKIAGPFEKAYGKTALSSSINKAVDKLNASGLLKWAADTAGEGFEEGMSDVLNTVADHIMGWDSGENSVWGDIAADKDEIMYDMLLGAFVGAFGATGNAVGNKVNTSPSAQAQPQAQQTESQQQAEQAAANNAPSQLDIDNGNARAYNNASDNSANNIGGMTDVAGRSVEADSGRVSGVYRGRDTVHRGEKKSPGVGVGSGLVLLSPQARDTLAKRGVAVVETQDVSNDKSAFSVALDAAQAQKNTAPTQEAEKKWLSMADYADKNSGVWNNLDYNDTAAQIKAMHEAHERMTAEGRVVEIPESTQKKTAESFPDLRGMNKSERTPILKQKMADLKSDIRQFLNGLKGGSFEFEVNGNVLEAKLYDTGIKEVLEKITQDKANMLNHSDLIFDNAEYLYSLPDYDGNPNVYRWNYFYTPVQIGDSIVGVRIALRDMKQTDSGKPESQIYNWGIKKTPALDGGSPEKTSLSTGVSSAGVIDTTSERYAAEKNGFSQADVMSVSDDISSDTSISPTPQNVKQNFEGNGATREPFTPTYNEKAQPPKKEKLSRFWENTLQRTETAAGVTEDVGEPLFYLPKTEKQSLAEAASRLSTDRQGTVENLVSAEAWSGAQVDSAANIASDLYREAQKTGNYEAYTAWRKVMDNHVIEGGRGIQALAKYSRETGENALSTIASTIEQSDLTPEQRQTLINKVGNYAARFDEITHGGENVELSDGKKAELISLIEDMARERGTWTFIKNLYSDLLKKQDGEYLNNYAYKQILAMGGDALSKAALAEKVKAYQTMAQLSSVATFKRNIGGNVSFGAVDTLVQDGLGVAIDHLLSKATGKRTVALDKGWFSSEARTGAIDAMQKSILEIAGDVDESQNRYDMTAGRAFKMSGGSLERFMSRWQQLLGYSLTTSDKFSRGAIESEQARGLNALKESGLTGEEIGELAKRVADYRLFQNQDGIAYKMSKGSHDVLNLAGFGGKVNGVTREGGFGLGDLVNTYPGVPANLGVKALEYSPANVVKGGIELIKVISDAKAGKLDVVKQQQAVMDISRGLAGLPAIALAGALFKAGLIKNWDDEDDPDIRAQNAAEGKTGVQINLTGALRYLTGKTSEITWEPGDNVESIGWLEPINAFLAIGSLMANEGEDAGIWDYAGDWVEGSIQGVLEIPVMSNIADIIDTLQYSTAENIGGKVAEAATQYAGNVAAGFIPSFVRAAAKASDEYYRDTSGDTPFERSWNQIKNAVPGLRQTLDVKLDNFGNPKKYGGTPLTRIYNAFSNPGDRKTITQSEASKIIESLYKETGNADIYPDRKGVNKISVNGENVSLTTKEKREYQRISGNTSENLIESLKNDPFYEKASPEQRAELIKELNSYAKDEAKVAWGKAKGAEVKSSYNDLREAGIADIPDYMLAKQVLSTANSATDKADYSLIDDILSNFGKLSVESRAELQSASNLNVNKLLYADNLDIDSQEWYKIHNAAKKNQETTGSRKDWATADAIGKLGGSDEDKLARLSAEIPPDGTNYNRVRGGYTRPSIIRRYDAAIKSGVDFDVWTDVEKIVEQLQNGNSDGWGCSKSFITQALADNGYTQKEIDDVWAIKNAAGDYDGVNHLDDYWGQLIENAGKAAAGK